MTAVVTQATLATLRDANYDTLSATFGVMGIILLLVLLALKEFLRSRARPQRGAGLQVFDIATMPLMMMFGFVILMRLLELLRL
jgi:hypothetical protein